MGSCESFNDGREVEPSQTGLEKQASNNKKVQVQVVNTNTAIKDIFHTKALYIIPPLAQLTHKKRQTKQKQTRMLCVCSSSDCKAQKGTREERKGNPQTKTAKLPSTSAPPTPALIGRNMQRCARPCLLQTQEKQQQKEADKGRDGTRNAKRVSASGDNEAKKERGEVVTSCFWMCSGETAGQVIL